MSAQQTYFPLIGPERYPTLIMEWLIVFSFLELAIFFLFRVLSKRDILKSLQEKAYIWLFLGYSLMWIFIIIGDYYIENQNSRLIILNIGFLLQIVCYCIFIYMMEKYKNFLFKFFFTIISAILFGINLIIFFLDISKAALVSTSFWIVFVLFLIFYFKKLYSVFFEKRKLGLIKYNILKFIIGFLLINVGYQLTTRLIVIYFGLTFRFIGDLFQLAGLVLLSLFLISIPSFSEYDWQEYINSIIIMHKSGLLIYKKNFKKEPYLVDESLIAGVITSLKMMLEKASLKKDFTIIEKKNTQIIIFSGKYIYGVLICEKRLESLQILLMNFVKKIELIYSGILERWNGDRNIFSSLDKIIKDFFL